MNRQPLTVAVVGATGVVGRTMIQVLIEREFPVGELRLLASGRSAGRTVVHRRSRRSRSARPSPTSFEGVDIALFSAGADISLDLAPAAVAHGAIVIDNSSAWRMDTAVPLVVSQVNPDDLEGHPGHHRQPELLDDAARARPDGAARHGRHRAGRGRHVPVGLRDGCRRRWRSSRPRSGRTSPASRRPPPSTRTRSRSTRSPRSTSSSRTATPRRSGSSSARTARSCTCRTCASRARQSASRSSSATRKPSMSRRASR